MYYRQLKFFYGHVITYGNVLVRNGLMKPFLSKAFTPQEGFEAIVRRISKRFRRGDFKMFRQVHVKDLHCGRLLGSKRDVWASLNDHKFGRAMFRFL